MASSPAAGSSVNGVKIPVAPSVCIPKTLPKPRGRSNTMGTSGSGTAAIDTPQLVKPSSVTKHSDTGGWKTNALDFHDQVLQEVERLIQTVEDKTTAKKACDTLKQARIPHGNRRKMTPENFLEKSKQIVTVIKRIELSGPTILRPPPT